MYGISLRGANDSDPRDYDSDDDELPIVEARRTRATERGSAWRMLRH